MYYDKEKTLQEVMEDFFNAMDAYEGEAYEPDEDYEPDFPGEDVKEVPDFERYIEEDEEEGETLVLVDFDLIFEALDEVRMPRCLAIRFLVALDGLMNDPEVSDKVIMVEQ